MGWVGAHGTLAHLIAVPRKCLIPLLPSTPADIGTFAPALAVAAEAVAAAAAHLARRRPRSTRRRVTIVGSGQVAICVLLCIVSRAAQLLAADVSAIAEGRPPPSRSRHTDAADPDLMTPPSQTDAYGATRGADSPNVVPSPPRQLAAAGASARVPVGHGTHTDFTQRDADAAITAADVVLRVLAEGGDLTVVSAYAAHEATVHTVAKIATAAIARGNPPGATGSALGATIGSAATTAASVTSPRGAYGAPQLVDGRWRIHTVPLSAALAICGDVAAAANGGVVDATTGGTAGRAVRREDAQWGLGFGPTGGTATVATTTAPTSSAHATSLGISATSAAAAGSIVGSDAVIVCAGVGGRGSALASRIVAAGGIVVDVGPPHETAPATRRDMGRAATFNEGVRGMATLVAPSLAATVATTLPRSVLAAAAAARTAGARHTHHPHSHSHPPVPMPTLRGSPRGSPGVSPRGSRRGTPTAPSANANGFPSPSPPRGASGAVAVPPTPAVGGARNGPWGAAASPADSRGPSLSPARSDAFADATAAGGRRDGSPAPATAGELAAAAAAAAYMRRGETGAPHPPLSAAAEATVSVLTRTRRPRTARAPPPAEPLFVDAVGAVMRPCGTGEKLAALAAAALNDATARAPSDRPYAHHAAAVAGVKGATVAHVMAHRRSTFVGAVEALADARVVLALAQLHTHRYLFPPGEWGGGAGAGRPPAALAAVSTRVAHGSPIRALVVCGSAAMERNVVMAKAVAALSVGLPVAARLPRGRYGADRVYADASTADVVIPSDGLFEAAVAATWRAQGGSPIALAAAEHDTVASPFEWAKYLGGAEWADPAGGPHIGIRPFAESGTLEAPLLSRDLRRLHEETEDSKLREMEVSTIAIHKSRRKTVLTDGVKAGLVPTATHWSDWSDPLLSPKCSK